MIIIKGPYRDMLSQEIFKILDIFMRKVDKDIKPLYADTS